MVRDTFITLVSREYTGVDAYGEPIYVEMKKRVYAQWDGVCRSEFYQAAAVGLQPTMVFRIYQRAYSDQRYVEYGGRRYRVVRTYPLVGERIELICTDDIAEDDEK